MWHSLCDHFYTNFLDLLVKGALLVQDYPWQWRIIEHISIPYGFKQVIPRAHFIDCPRMVTWQEWINVLTKGTCSKSVFYIYVGVCSLFMDPSRK